VSTPLPDRGSSRRKVGYAVAWVVAAVLAVTVGVLAVNGLGASIRDRGPTVNDAVREAQLNEEREGGATPNPDDTRSRKDIRDEFGVFVVECQGPIATGVRTEPAAGWRTVSYETGPDDDVDAVFARAAESIELEVFCNRGVPTIADLERKTLPDDDE
jgi:hypothetical protein